MLQQLGHHVSMVGVAWQSSACWLGCEVGGFVDRRTKRSRSGGRGGGDDVAISQPE